MRPSLCSLLPARPPDNPAADRYNAATNTSGEADKAPVTSLRRFYRVRPRGVHSSAEKRKASQR